MPPASTTPFPADAEGDDHAIGYAVGASACADERCQPDAGKAHAAGDISGSRAVPEPDWFLSAVMPGGWGAPRLQLLAEQHPAAPSPAGRAGAGQAAGRAADGQRAASCAAAAPGHESGAPSAQPACERPFAALSPSEVAAGPPGAAGEVSAAAGSDGERVPAPGPVSPMGTAEAEAALARAVAAGAAALLERGDARRACAALQDGLLQVQAHCGAAIQAQVAGREESVAPWPGLLVSARPAPRMLLCASLLWATLLQLCCAL